MQLLVAGAAAAAAAAAAAGAATAWNIPLAWLLDRHKFEAVTIEQPC
jgi:fructose-specific phosphotransferase system IIC component